MEVVEVKKSFVLTGIYADAPDQGCGNYCTSPEEMLAKGDECWPLDY